MKLGSLFDGIGGFPLAATRCGITPVWASEIEKGPVEITKRHFPLMKHYGDVTKINGFEVEPVDVITFGSPCQDLSVAGKRAGLEGERSGLFGEAVRIIKEMRNGTNGSFPRFAVWENVPGAFSSNGGQDFRTVIEELCRVRDPRAEVPMPADRWKPAGLVVGKGYSVAWRVLDAQYWGVPQRRKRIFVVADFRGSSAGKVLFERESLRRDSAKGESTGQGTATDVERGVGAAGSGPAGVPGVEEDGSLTPWDVQSRRIHPETGTWPALYGGEGGGRGYVAQTAVGVSESPDVGHCLRSGASKADKHESTTYILFEPRSQDGVHRIHGDITPSLNTAQGGQRQPCIAQPAYAVRMREGCEGGGKGPLIQTDKSGTIATGNDQTIFAPAGFFSMQAIGEHKESSSSSSSLKQRDYKDATDLVVAAVDCRNLYETDEVSGTLQSKNGGGYSHNYQNPIRRGYKVRRLTPTECERPQGFPDGWTEGFADTVRYKALGNSVAEPCVEFVMEGIARQ